MENKERAPDFVQEFVNHISAQAMVQCAIPINGDYLGYIGINDCRAPRKFSAEEKNIFITATEIISIFLTNKRIEQEKEKYTDALSSILNHMQSSVYVINPQTFKIIFMNQKTIELFPDAKIGHNCYTAFRKQNAPCVDCFIQSAESASAEENGKTLQIYNLQTGKWIGTCINWIKWLDEQQYCLINCTDITKFKTDL